MYRKILLVAVTVASSSCGVMPLSNKQSNVAIEQQLDEVNINYSVLQQQNLEKIKKYQPEISDNEIESKVRNLTMDLLGKTDINENTRVFINPITVINVDSLPYSFERNQLINNLVTQELLDYGISVVEDTVFEENLEAQNQLLILEIQINKYQDMYYVNCTFKQANSNKIHAMVKAEFPFLLLENVRDGVTLLN